MCLAAFALNASGHWPLVLASNRDEFFDRPALALSRWQSDTGSMLISGRDVRAGGTWLGMTAGGRVALLTNVREAAAPAAPCTRGELAVRWLESTDDAAAFTRQIDGQVYGGFNLVLGDIARGQWHWLSNRPAGMSTLVPQPLADGIYGLSNASLDTAWPKTLALKNAMANALQAPSLPALESMLFAALGNQQRAAPEQLPATGVSPELEMALSSAHVSIAERNYGTRCASVLVVQAAPDSASRNPCRGEVRFTETTFAGPATSHTHAPAPAPAPALASGSGMQSAGEADGGPKIDFDLHANTATVVYQFALQCALPGPAQLHLRQ